MVEGHLLAAVGEFDPRGDELQGLGTCPTRGCDATP